MGKLVDGRTGAACQSVAKCDGVCGGICVGKMDTEGRMDRERERETAAVAAAP